MNENNVILSIDVGGTFYKTALISFDGNLIEKTFNQIPSYSNEDKSKIVFQFKFLLSLMKNIAIEQNLKISKVCIDFPGPFDYINCCCKMKHKFLAIKDLSLKPIVNQIIACDDISFHYDLHASTMGAYLFDEAQGYSNIFCIGLGTGLGSGYLKDGKIISVNQGQPKYPIFQLEVGDSILEDYVSNRGIIEEYRKKSGYFGELDAKKVEEFAKIGDEIAIDVYKQLGQILANTIYSLIIMLKIECIVFCGQISKGYSFFGPSFENVISKSPYIKKISPVKNFDALALLGVCFLEEEE
ncbi:MAG: ROK family protein [Spirochaetia bacterium]|nr:ROK family protein [Spirochaetia bacterium]